MDGRSGDFVRSSPDVCAPFLPKWIGSLEVKRKCSVGSNLVYVLCLENGVIANVRILYA